MQYFFACLRLNLAPPNWTYRYNCTENINVATLFMHLSVVSDTYTYEDVGNCLLVKNGDSYRVF